MDNEFDDDLKAIIDQFPDPSRSPRRGSSQPSSQRKAPSEKRLQKDTFGKLVFREQILVLIEKNPRDVSFVKILDKPSLRDTTSFTDHLRGVQLPIGILTQSVHLRNVPC